MHRGHVRLFVTTKLVNKVILLKSRDEIRLFATDFDLGSFAEFLQLVAVALFKPVSLGCLLGLLLRRASSVVAEREKHSGELSGMRYGHSRVSTSRLQV